MRTFLRFISVLILLCSFICDAHATKRYWVGATSNSWKTTANWSTSSGGGGGASIPGSSDTAIFDGNATSRHRCNLDSLVNVKRLAISGDTLSQGSYTITIGTSGANLTGGIFLGGSTDITVSGAISITGCKFTSTSGTLSTSANFTRSGAGSFIHNNGLLKFTATCTITGTDTLYQLEFAPTATATFTIAGGTTLKVNNTLTIGGSATTTFNTGDISAKGDINITNTAFGSGGSATITISGTVKQTMTGASTNGWGRLPNLTINKSDTLKLVNFISAGGTWTYTAGVIDAGTSTVHFANTLTITGSHTLYNVYFTATAARTYTISPGTTITALGTVLISGTADITINTGTINAQGDVIVSNSATAGGGSATININGTGSQLFQGNGTGGHGLLPNIVINKSSGTLTLDSTISIKKNWTYTAGVITPTNSSVVYFISTKKITSTGSDTLGGVTFDGSAAATYTIATGSTLRAAGLLTINGTSAVTLDSGLIHSAGNITVSNTASTATGNASLIINGAGNQTLTGSGTAGQGRLPKITIDKASGVLTLASVISVYGDWIYTKGSVAEGTSSVALYGTSNLDGQLSGGSSLMRFYSLAVSADTRTLTGNIDVNKNFTIASGATLSAGSNSIYLAGNWNSQGTWTYGTGTVIFDSTGYKQITGASGAQVNFYNITFNKYYSTTSPSSLTLARPLKVNHTATFTQGHIKSTSTNYLEFADDATLSGGNDSAYVHGPVRKTGDDAFTFPLGDTTLVDTAYHPLAMTAPSGTSDQFEATYFAVAQTLGDSLVDTLASISADEYWKLERLIGSSNVYVTLGWNYNSTNVSDINTVRVGGWNGVKWLDYGRTSVTFSDRHGSVTSTLTPGYSSGIAYLTFGTSVSPIVYATLHRKLDGGYYLVTDGALYFKYDEEYNDVDGNLTFNIYDQQHNIQASGTGSSAILLPSNYGDNRFFINLLDCSTTPTGYLGEGYFILEVINGKNEKWYLRFNHNLTFSPFCTGGGGGS